MYILQSSVNMHL